MTSEPMSLEERVLEVLEVVLMAAETSEVRGDEDQSRPLLEGPFLRRLEKAVLMPMPLTALRDEARMAYATALSLARTVLAAVTAQGDSLTDAVQALVDGAKQ